MSVGFSVRVDVRPYTGYDDPGLPIAAWISQAGVVGNASGGTLNIDFLFQLDAQPLTTELYNLEQVSADTSAEAERQFSLETLNMDQLALNREGSPQKWRSRVLAATGSGIAATELDGATILPLWLGAPNRAEGDSGIRMFWQNADLLLYAVTLQGYIWGPRSVMAAGGPRRPVGGLFGKG